MNKHIPLQILFLLLSISGFSQISNVQGVVSGVPLRTNTYDYIEGTPYFGGAVWKSGTLTDIDGKIYNNVQLRFNSYDNELEYLRKSGAIVVSKNQITSFELNIPDIYGSVNSYIFRNGFEAGKDLNFSDFVRVIYTGENFSIVEKISKKRITVTPAAYGEKDFEKFVEDNAFYFLGKDDLKKIKLNKKNFLDLFPNYKLEIKDFVKKHSVNFNNIEEVEALAQYIDKSLES